MENSNKKFLRQANLLIYLSTFGIMILLLYISLGNFNNPLFKNLFLKKTSLAFELSQTPKVELSLIYQGKSYQSHFNIPVNETSQLTLKWTVSGNPTKCYGWSFGKNSEDKIWPGEKSFNGGSYKIPNLNKPDVYVYNIECSNNKGDAEGDTLVINVGALDNKPTPYISQFSLLDIKGQKYPANSSLNLSKGSTVEYSWSGINISTPYSICVSTGSWPTKYTNLGSTLVKKTQTLQYAKVYQLRLFCSNEQSFTTTSFAVLSE